MANDRILIQNLNRIGFNQNEKDYALHKFNRVNPERQANALWCIKQMETQFKDPTLKNVAAGNYLSQQVQ